MPTVLALVGSAIEVRLSVAQLEWRAVMPSCNRCGAPQQISGNLLPGVTVVVPVFRSTVTLPELVDRVHKALEGQPHELILVDDGSPPATWEIVKEIVRRDPTVSGVRFGRNAGQHGALLAGVRVARHEVTVTIDDDLQNPPEEIPRLVAQLDSGVDVVYGTATAVAQRRWRRSSSFLTRRLLSSALGAESASHLSAFRAFRTALRHGFDGDLGPGVSLDALLAWSTERFGVLTVDHHERSDGRSTYSLRRLLRFAVDTATGYSTVPLQIALSVGLVTAAFGVVVLAWVIGRAVLGEPSVPGFPFIASIVAIFSGVQLVTLGVIGEYLARMHFRVMHKPTYVIAEHIGRNSPEA